MAAYVEGRAAIEVRRRLRETRANSLVAAARFVGIEREHRGAVVDDGEFVDETLEFGDEVRGNQNGAIAEIAVLVGADDGLDKLAAHDGVEAGGGLMENEHVAL